MGRGSNKGRMPQQGVAQHVNAYLELIGPHGKTQESVVAINGQENFATCTGAMGVRALHERSSVALAVVDRVLFTLSIGGAALVAGGIGADGPVFMATNKKTPSAQTAIVCDGLWYLYDAGGLVQGSDPDLPPPIAVVESDGYLFFIIRDGRFFIAGPNEGSAIDPLDFAEAESSSDENVGAAIRGRTLIPFGTKSIEFWDPNGDEVFPYARTQAIDIGCFAGGTIANVAVTGQNGQITDTVMFAGADQSGAYIGVMMLEGYSAVVVSTPYLDRLIRDEPTKDNLRAFSWTEDGHNFYAISGTNFTEVFDGKTREWHTRRSHGRNRWNPNCVCHFSGMTLFGHETSNVIRKSLATLFDEAGDPIHYEVIPPPIHRWPEGIKVNAVYADMVTGVGRNIGDDDTDEPEIVMDASGDGGVHYGAARRVKIGSQGQRHVRVRERMWGLYDHNGMTLRIRCSAAVVKVLQQLAVDADPVRAR